MSTEPQPSNATSTAASRLVSVVRLVASIARRSRGLVGFLALLGLASASWLVFYCFKTFQLSWIGLAVTGSLLALPGLLLAYVYWILLELLDLPDRLDGYLKTLRGRGDALKLKLTQQSGQAQPSDQPARSFGLWGLGKALVEMQSLAANFQDIAFLWGNVLVISNPVFVLMIAIAAGTAILLGLGAGITALVYAF